MKKLMIKFGSSKIKFTPNPLNFLGHICYHGFGVIQVVLFPIESSLRSLSANMNFLHRLFFQNNLRLLLFCLSYFLLAILIFISGQ
jgi:hypothetical protein